jgi:hypothetical protein
MKEKYPFASLKHGESFLVPCAADERADVSNRLSVTAATWHAHPDNFCRFVTRWEDAGMRVVRVA